MKSDSQHAFLQTHHGDPRLEALVAVCEAGLRRVLQAETADIYLYASNGHGVWEAATENLIAPGQAF